MIAPDPLVALTVRYLAAISFDAAMEAYPYVFHPVTLLGTGFVILIYYEWNRLPASRSALWKRLGVLVGSGAAALVPTAVYMVVTGQGIAEATQGNVWQVDWLVGGGVTLAATVLWVVWEREEWGPLVPAAMEAVVVLMVPYLALSPFWNVSGHVLLAVFPALYLTLVDVKFWPLNLVPLVMVPNRIYLGAHGWPETIGGLVIAVTLTTAVFWLQSDRRDAFVDGPVSS